MNDDWREDALCRGMDVNYFFPHRGDFPGIKAAKRFCQQCPVRAECLADAMRVEADLSATGRHGIRGGLTSGQRARLAKGERT